MKNPITQRRGFTIIELLVVVAIMAVIATLATGAAIKSVKQNRNKRIDTMAKALEMSLVNYRALYGKWPVDFVGDYKGDLDKDGVKIVLKGDVKNAAVFKEILNAVRQNRALLDTSALLTRVKGSQMSVRDALAKYPGSDIPIGYPDHEPKPDDPPQYKMFKYYTVEYYLTTESVKVKRWVK